MAVPIRLGFLPDQLLNAEQAYFRSTNMARTMESLQHIISGLYPAEKCSNTPPPILVRCVRRALSLQSRRDSHWKYTQERER